MKKIYFLMSFGCCLIGNNAVANVATPTKRDFKLNPDSRPKLHISLSVINNLQTQIYKENADGTLTEICSFEKLNTLATREGSEIYWALRHMDKENLNHMLDLIRSQNEVPCTHCPDINLEGLSIPGAIIVRDPARIQLDPCQKVRSDMLQKVAAALAKQSEPKETIAPTVAKK